MTRRWGLVLIVGAGCVICLALFIAAEWLLGGGTRGAEIANVLAFPVAAAALLLAAAPTVQLIVSWIRTLPPTRPPGGRRRALAGRLQAHVTAPRALALVLVPALVVAGAEVGRPLAERVVLWHNGCGHPTQLRMLTAPDQVEPLLTVARAYQGGTAEEHHGCATVSVAVSGAPTEPAAAALGAGWTDAALRDLGPAPDVWFTDSPASTYAVADASADLTGRVIGNVPVATSPVVLAAPALAVADLVGQREALTWPELFREAVARGWDVVRADPATSAAAGTATALLYGADAEPTAPRTVEQRIGASLDRGGYPLDGDLAVLCRARLNPAGPVAVVSSEQALRRFNRGDPLGGDCGRRSDPRAGGSVLLGFYPEGTRSVEHRLVRFGRGGADQRRHAQAFGEWLSTAPGRRALRDAGLRPPPGLQQDAQPDRNQEHGVLPLARVDQTPAPPELLAIALRRHALAHRHGRVLLALDASGSMAESAGFGEGTLFDVARLGVQRALNLMGEQDEFGLWVFPDELDGHRAGELVPIGRRNDPIGAEPRHAVTTSALTRARPVGSHTPLFPAITAGLDAVGPSDASRVSALVVLTDGRNTSPGPTAADVRDAVQGSDVRLFVLAVGRETCDGIGLSDIASSTGGRCADVDRGSIDAELAELFGTLWSGA